MEIVDAGSPYVERANALIGGGFRADLAVAAALAGQRVSFGELISHQVTVNSLSDISRVFSKLFDCSILDEIKSTQDRFSVEILGKIPKPILNNPALTYSSIEDLFSCRHVIVHELPQNGYDLITQVQEKYQAVYDLISAIDKFVKAGLHGNFPLTQTGINTAAAESATQADAELQQMLDTLGPSSKDDLLQKSQQAWLNYRLATAELIASVVQGGSIWSSLYSSAYEQITRVRIDELRRFEETL